MTDRPGAPGAAPAERSGPPRVVVGAAILRAGRVLAACRSAPAHLAGGWEFPGGKQEPGESEAEALVRECREELGVAVRAVGRLPGAWPLAPGYVLHLWHAELLSGEPLPLEDHSELRWLGPHELDEVDWLPQDRDAVAVVAGLMATTRAG
ncbi:(deoxy)nucleoside triphosphate pyrophosphohydrolase [Yinghuangia seranimata]|uniref:(deoxy)nucleoside triphosphate pyrophosphohydrolase n=1 Tax=Yinghuangia seranimata TaxID=408067 RepID=UPI00248D33A7|nr:(deoxy)nucleoside triphosphate pyrophosphohydrolase [Yinghuangia seranimata]MDI2128900.1 (deoxy)nucleoside triphosphate pyrophosphohydrolase [Yinghuangia seranimata]